MKRSFDLILGLFAATVMLVPIVMLAVLVRLTSPGPALYWSDRVGRHNNIFKMPKFRSMRVGTPTIATHLLADPKSVLTPIGSFIRKTSLDELPQFINVLKRDMSVVGPRPPLASEVKTYDDYARKRLLVRPGITGLWQVSGRSDLSWEDSVRLDLFYVENWSMMADLLIALKTVKAMLGHSGAY